MHSLCAIRGSNPGPGYHAYKARILQTELQPSLLFITESLVNGSFRSCIFSEKLTDTQLESESGEFVSGFVASLLAYCVRLVKAMNLSGGSLNTVIG